MYREPKNIELWPKLLFDLIAGAPADEAAILKTGAYYGEKHRWRQKRSGAEPICRQIKGLKAAFWA